MRILSPPGRLLLPALLLATACAESTTPGVGGEYIGRLDSPYSIEGAALIDLHSPDLRMVSAPGRILVARGSSERTLRILVVNRPVIPVVGGPIVFHVRMPQGVEPPRATVVAVSGAQNEARSFAGGYAVRWSRAEPSPSFSVAAAAPLQQTAPVPPPIRFARLVAPLFPGGQPLTQPEVNIADKLGNANTVYDLGDVRGYLRIHPSEMPPEFVWTR